MDAKRENIGPKVVQNIILANNATAVAAAAEEAKRLGYVVASESATHSEGQTEEVGRDLAEKTLAMQAHATRQVGAAVELPPQPIVPTCFISGGEPVVKLVESSRRGLGGRNQQLVLAAPWRGCSTTAAEGIALLSGGTDGEDGPTDAAGAFLDADVLAAARRKAPRSGRFSRPQRRLSLFRAARRAIKTGPTQTNVCDVRVVIAAR